MEHVSLNEVALALPWLGALPALLGRFEAAKTQHLKFPLNPKP